MSDDLVNRVADMVQEAMIKHDCGIRSLHVPSVANEIIAVVKAEVIEAVENAFKNKPLGWQIGNDWIIRSIKVDDAIKAINQL